MVLIVVLALATSVTLSGCSWFHDSGKTTFSHGIAAADGLGARIFADGHDGAAVTFRAVKKPPAAPALAFAVTIGSPVEITPPADVTTAELRLSFDPDKDLAAPATVANAFIAAYSGDDESWVPLATTFDSQQHELVARAPHFSIFGRFAVRPGHFSLPNPITTINAGLAAVGSGLSKTVDVVTDATTTGLTALDDYVLPAARDYLDHLKEEFTGGYPDDRHVDCGGGHDPAGEPIKESTAKNAPSGKAVAAKGWTAGTSGGFADKLLTCVVDDPAAPQPTRWLRMENHIGAPLTLPSISP